MAKNGSFKSHDDTTISSKAKTLQSKYQSIDHESIINSITGYKDDLQYKLEQVDREADIQAQQIELSKCLECVAQLVDLFKHSVISMELRNQADFYKNAEEHHQEQQTNTVTTSGLVDERIEHIVANNGVTKEQWSCLLYMTLSTGDTAELTKVSRKHLQRVREKALRLLEGNEKDAVFALINAIEQCMTKNHLTEK